MLKLQVFTAFFPSLLLMSNAHSQDQVELSTIPLLDVYELTEPQRAWWKQRRDREPAGFRLRLGAGTGQREGNSTSFGIASLTLGVKVPGLSLAATSSVSADRGALSGSENRLRGYHRALAIKRIGDSGNERDAQLALEAWMRHSGPRRFRLDAPRFGSAPMQTHGASLTARLRLMHHSNFGLSLPIKYSTENISWSQLTAFSTIHALSTGLGFAPSRSGDVRGTIDALRGRVEHRRYGGSVAARKAYGTTGPQHSFRKASVGIGTTDYVFREGSYTLLSATAHLGWSWLELQHGAMTSHNRSLDLFMAGHMRWGRPEHQSRLGLALARTPSATADGSSMLLNSRIELTGNVEQEQFDIGVRAGLSRLRPLASGKESPTPVLVYGTRVDAYYKLPANLKVGVYLTTSLEPAATGLNPWDKPRVWLTESGVLLRIGLGMPPST